MPAVSKKQQKFMGIVHGLQKGTVKPSEVSKKAQNVAKDMKPKAATDFASTKHKGLPTKVKKENVDGAIDTLYMVKKPFDGCNASSLVAPLDPLQGAQDQADRGSPSRCGVPDCEHLSPQGVPAFGGVPRQVVARLRGWGRGVPAVAAGRVGDYRRV